MIETRVRFEWRNIHEYSDCLTESLRIGEKDENQDIITSLLFAAKGGGDVKKN